MDKWTNVALPPSISVANDWGCPLSMLISDQENTTEQEYGSIGETFSSFLLLAENVNGWPARLAAHCFHPNSYHWIENLCCRRRHLQTQVAKIFTRKKSIRYSTANVIKMVRTSGVTCVLLRFHSIGQSQFIYKFHGHQNDQQNNDENKMNINGIRQLFRSFQF